MNTLRSLKVLDQCSVDEADGCTRHGDGTHSADASQNLHIFQL